MTAVVAVAIILIMVLINPFQNTGSRSDDDTLVWEDGFFANADWMNQEIDRIHSGRLLVNYYSSGQESDDASFDWVSTMSNELSELRGAVETLEQSIAGI
jgi:hypothetical protein